MEGRKEGRKGKTGEGKGKTRGGEGEDKGKGRGREGEGKGKTRGREGEGKGKGLTKKRRRRRRRRRRRSSSSSSSRSRSRSRRGNPCQKALALQQFILHSRNVPLDISVVGDLALQLWQWYTAVQVSGAHSQPHDGLGCSSTDFRWQRLSNFEVCETREPLAPGSTRKKG